MFMTYDPSVIPKTATAVRERIAETFPAECVTDCPALRTVVDEHISAMTINAQKGLASADRDVARGAADRREEMESEFTERINFMAERCFRAHQ